MTGHSLGRVIYLMNGHSIELDPPLFFILAWVSERLGGDSAQSLKLVSLVAGTATIPLTYVLERVTPAPRVRRDRIDLQREPSHLGPRV